jgi:hypothetical protein
VSGLLVVPGFDFGTGLFRGLWAAVASDEADRLFTPALREAGCDGEEVPNNCLVFL